MGKGPSIESVNSLVQQAEAVRRAAATSDELITRNFAKKAADTLDSLAQSQLNRIKKDADPVQVLADNASVSEMRHARQRRAVRRGDSVYLPSGREGSIALPNVLLRSSLFAAATADRSTFASHELASQGDTSLRMEGRRLYDYDRRVFAVCVNSYRGDRRLCSDHADEWVKMTFWQLAKALHVSYGANVHQSIRNSLERLNEATIQVRIKGVDIATTRLIRVSFEADPELDVTPGRPTRGSDTVAFQVPDTLANLFGRARWTAVEESVLHSFSGLPSWLACFYSTHQSAYALSVEDLWRYSGVLCDLREFRRRLNTALLRLQAEDVPTQVRVERFTISNGKLLVELVRWSGKSMAGC